MNFTGEFWPSTADPVSSASAVTGLGSLPGAVTTFTVGDAELLFAGNFERHGRDLIISDQAHHLVVPNYFSVGKRPLLVSAEGALLDPAVVDALTGHTQYAQAGSASAGKLVGNIVKMTGSASIVRNGVAIDVQVGDAVYQSDVLQTGSSSTIGLVLVDGTAFNLSANTRLMLNDLTFDVSSTSNSSLITLVQGAASFVAGQVAKTGDMKVATPAAVIGVRGTAVKLDITSTNGRVDISVIDQRDGQVHSVEVFNNAGDQIATVSSNGPSLSVTPTTNLDVVIQQNNKTPAQIAQEFGTYQAAIDTYNVQKQINPNLPQHTENTGGDNANTGQTRTASGSTPAEPLATEPFVQLASLTTQGASSEVVASTGLIIVTSGSNSTGGTTTSSTSNTVADIPVAPLLKTAAPTVTANLTVVTGSSSSGGITSNSELNGTGLPNTIVNFTIDGTPIASTVVADAQGRWTFQPIGLADGTHTIVASQTDTFGNTGTASLSFTLDTVAPSGGTPSLIAGSDTGSVSTDNITAATAPTFAVLLNPSVVAGDTVELLLAGSPPAHPVKHVITASDVVAGSVALTLVSGDLGADGPKQVTAQFRDTAGNSSVGLAQDFTLDTAAPLVVITSAGGLASQTQTIAGTVDLADAGATVTIFNGANPIGSATVQSDGTWSSGVTLNIGNNALTAQVVDAAGNLGISNSVIYTIDQAPVATPVTLAAGTEDTAYTINAAALLAGVTDVDGQALTITAVSVASGGGSLVNNGNGTWTYTPAANFDGPVSFNYTAFDGSLSASSTASLTLAAVNDAPVITVASLTVDEGGTVLITPASIGVTDPDSSSFAFTVSNVTHGAFQTTTDGVTWTNATSFTTADLAASHVRFVHDGSVTAPTFSIQANDGAALNNLSNVFVGSVLFNSVNHAPVATPVTLAAGTEDTAYTINAAALLAGVTDVDGQALTITAVSVASGGGSLVNNGNGTWTYTPAANFDGPVSFNYTASDGSLSASSTASLTLAAVNDAPTATNLSTTETYTQGVPLNLVDIVVSDVDSANVTATLTLSNVAAGSLNTATSGAVTSTYNAATGVWTASGAIANVNALLAGLTLTPAANFNGNFSIATSISDGVAPAITGSKAFTGIAVNAPPTATNLSTAESYTEDTPLNLVDIVVSDVDSANVTATLTLSNVAAGSLNTATSGAVTSTYNAATGVWTASGAIANVNALLAGLTLTPAANFNGSFSIATSISDGVAPAITGSKVFTGIAVNDAPVATPVTLAAGTEDTAYTINAAALLAGVTDVDGQALTITSVSVASGGGSIVNNGNGTWTYTPAANFDGPVSFNYTASDGSLSASSTASLTLAAVNDAPVATPVTLAAGTEDTAYTINAATLLAGVTDVDGPSPTITAVSVASGGGSIVNNGNGTWTYTPAANWNGPVSFNYTASDGSLSASSIATLILNPVNDAPVAAPVTLAAGTEDTAYTINAAALLAGVTDVDGQALTITAVSVASGGGSLVNNGNGTWTYTPAADFNGPVSFNYTASDGSLSASSTASLTLAAVNDAPTATNLSTTETYTQGVPLNLVDIVVSDVDSANVTATLTLSNVAAGSLSTATSGAVTSTYNAATGVWTASGAIANVNVLLAGLTLTPAANFNGSFSIATSISDGVAPAITGSKAFTGIAVNAPPTATNLSAAESYTEDTPLNLVDIVVSDVDSANVTATLTLSNVAAGSLSTATSGAVTSTYNVATGVWTASGAIANVNALLAGLTLTPAANFNGSFSIATSISDGVAPAITGSKAFTGIAVNDAPVATPVTLAAGTEDTAYTINAAALLAGVTDVDGQALTITSVSVASGGGSIVNNGNGTWTYTPAADFNGPVSFNYTASDGSLSASSTANVFISPVNDAPTATNLSTAETYTEDTPLNLVDIVVSDVDSANVTATLTLSNVAAGSLSTATSGAVTSTYNAATGVWTASGAIANVNALLAGLTLTPAANFNGSFSIATSISDGVAPAITGSKAFTGIAVNDAPVASPVTLTAGTANTQYTITAAMLLAGVTDVDGPSSSITSVTVASGGGSIVNNGGGNWTYTPVAGYVGPVSFNYVATDGSLTANSTANLTLNAPGIINGTAGADILVGTSQTDSIFGLAGNDIIKGLGGNDQIDGGTGRDVADYSDASDGVGITVDMAAGTVSGGASVGTDTLRSIENIRGTDFADTYVAIGFNQSSPNNAQDIPIQSTINNIFEGGGGNDTIIGSSGSQASYATGNGGTQISYAHALASVTVDLRDGTAFGTAANDVAHVGTDTFSQVSGVVGSDFNDTLLGSNSASHGDVFFGGAGNDFIDGRVGYDFVGYYANFNPASITSGITVNLAAGTVTGDASVGTDTLRSIEIVRGTQFDDIYNAAGFGLAGALNVSDMGSFNQFEGMGGNDTITGNGNTRIDYNFASASVTVDFQLGTAHSTAADDAGIGTDTFDTGVNSVRGSSFNDVLLGSGGNENFLGGRGDDLIDGRNGFDRAVYSTSSDDAVTSGITVNLAAGTVQGDASVGLDTLRSVEAIQGTDFADSYSATGFGITGNNVGNYGTFNEFEGGSGNDTITGNGNTRIAFYNAAAAVTVNLTTGISQGTAGGDLAAVGTDTFTGVTAIAGSSFADTFTGSDNAANTAEEFAGRGGNDTIDGRGGFDRAFYSDESTATGIQVNMASGTVTGDAAIGTDTLRSVEGIRGTNFADTYVATNFGVSGLNVGNFGTFNEFEGMRGNDSITGNGNTRIAFYNALAAVTVDLSLGISRGTAADDVAGVGTDGFTGVNAVRGSNFADTIFGDGNANALEGRDGDDQLDGRGGADTLTGGNGADTFIYGDGSGADTIADFNRVQGDLIDVSAVSAVASFADIQSRTTVVGGNTVIDFGNGNTLTLTGVTSIQQSDFVFRNVVNGTSAADVLLGTSRADAVFGLAGNDIIKGLEGDDQLDGGTGRDVADYSDATGAISVNMASGTVSGNASVGNDTLRSIESVRGTDFDDSYLATGFNQTSPNNAQDIQIQSNINNTFEGGGGNDTIVGSSGAQSSYSTGNGGTQVSYAHAAAAVIVDLRAGTARGIAANDVAHVGVDALQFVNGVVGSNFNDTLSGTDSAIHVDVFYGGQGDDTIDGRDGYDIVTYNPFFDASVITGPITVNLAAGTVAGDASVGTDTLRSVELVRGTSFNDVYNAAGFGSAGALNVSNTGTFNQFEGMAGNDTIIGNGNTRADYNFASAAVTVDLQLGSGRSTVADDAGVGIDTLDSGVNSARGSAFNDTLLGSSRNEYLLGGRGDDLIDGRNGFDRAVYSTASEDAVTSGIVVNLAAGTVQGDASVGTDTLRSIEGITGSDFADTFNATGYGLAGASNVGNNGTFNEIEGGGGNDSITGNGNTRIAFYNALDGVTVDLGGGTSRGTAANDLAQVGTDTFTGVSSVAGSAFDDTIAGSNNAANTAEDFGGREGNDFIDGLGGFDRAFYHNDSSTLSGINVNLAFGIVTGDATIGTDTLRSVEGIRGTNFADTFNASNFGAAGFLDALVNNVGNFGTFNEFEGMGGNDSITGNGNTRIAFYNAADGVTVDLAAGNSHGTAAADVAGVGTDTFSGVNAVRGSAFNDAVAGGSGNETLDGQGGDDVIQGRGGADTLIGGGGADRFVFNAISDSSIAASDTISDFVHGADVIDTFGISGITSVQGLISGSTQVAAHSIVWAQSGANTIVYMNSSGVAQDQSAADMRIVLTGVTASTLTSSDFFHF